VRLWRVLPWDPSASAAEPGGPLWFPRGVQGAGRHDNPGRYVALYVSEAPVSAVAEALAPFRGSGDLEPDLLVRAGRPLALAALALDDDVALVDLDEPRTLARERLRPSQVASHVRAGTRAYALALFDAHPRAAGLRWWSTLESTWLNVTLHDRAAPALAVDDVAVLSVEHPEVRGAARFLGLA
jgi:RES domain